MSTTTLAGCYGFTAVRADTSVPGHAIASVQYAAINTLLSSQQKSKPCCNQAHSKRVTSLTSGAYAANGDSLLFHVRVRYKFGLLNRRKMLRACTPWRKSPEANSHEKKTVGPHV